MKFYTGDSLKCVQKIQVSLKPIKKSGILHEDLCTLTVISRSILSKMKEFRIKFVQKIKTFRINTSVSENRAVYEAITKNIAKPDGP